MNLLSINTKNTVQAHSANTYKIPYIIHVNYSSTAWWSNGIILQSNARAKHLHMVPLMFNKKDGIRTNFKKDVLTL